MTTIHLTDAQRDQLQACGLFTIDEADLAAWTEATKPCDTCHGDEEIADPEYGYGNSGFMIACPNLDCVGGLPVVTFTATCYACSAAGCLGSGVVTLGRFTIPALLPVVASHDSVNVAAYIFVDEGGAELWADDGDADYDLIELLPLDPLPHPGQFIARPECVG